MPIIVEVNPCEDCEFAGLKQFPNVVSNLAYLCAFALLPRTSVSATLLVVFLASTIWHATLITRFLWGDRLAIVFAIGVMTWQYGFGNAASALLKSGPALPVSLAFLFIGELEKHDLIPCTGLYTHALWHIYSALVVYRTMATLTV